MNKQTRIKGLLGKPVILHLFHNACPKDAVPEMFGIVKEVDDDCFIFTAKEPWMDCPVDFIVDFRAVAAVQDREIRMGE